MALKIEKQIRQGLPQVGIKPYGQVHAHSTGNPSSTAQNEADYHMRRPVESGFFSHVVGNGRIIQTAPVNRGAYDVGGGWNAWGYAHVELIESHKTKAEFTRDYKLYVELLRQLAKEAKIPLKVDAGNVGILSHEYCTKHQPNNGSDHIDPYPYLAKWGISRAQFKKDVEKGFGNTSSSSSSGLAKNPKPLNDGKVGDTVKVYDALYANADGAGRSTSSRGKTAKITRVLAGKSKKYLVGNLGWAHPNDLQVVNTSTGYAAKKVGDTVTVQSFATHYQTGQKIASFVKGKKYKIKQVKNVNQSKSKRAYLLENINSWVLEQDVK
ncbi:N-acetylmuramoyl-L-alanine amidase [Enterococcus dispar]|uniref:N-acetylmuramoyl-L-alanine amidase n=1 Tax=Enterococcus dispar TaxID=44009 RepID=UPI00232EC73F|nr:N-acetylmuramoyl-L-alanine amidase [Enterococcus dispar]WCG33007.1 N-acetylmuramoyl-L-alanine amidase [Enterococcus dispar]